MDGVHVHLPFEKLEVQLSLIDILHSDATMVPERRQRAGFITLVVSGIVFTIAVDRQVGDALIS